MSIAKNRLEEGLHTSGLPAIEKAQTSHLPQLISKPHRFPFPTSAAHYIGGKLVDSTNGGVIPVFNPCTEEGIRDVPNASPQDIENAIAAAKLAYTEEWSSLTHFQRAKYLLRIADLIESQMDLFVYLEGVDGGATVANGTGDVRICCSTIRSLVHTHNIVSSTKFGVQMSESCGVISILLPSRNPLSCMARSVIAALLHGNTVVAIAEDDAPLATLQLASVLTQAHLPDGVLNILTGSKAVKDSSLLIHKDITRAIIVEEACSGETILSLLPRGISQTMCVREFMGFNRLEVHALGRSFAPVPAIITSNVNVDKVADEIVDAVVVRTRALKTKWALVHESVYGSFLEAIIKRFEEVHVGDASLRAGIQMGPLSSKEKYRRMKECIEALTKLGGTIAASEKKLPARGYFVRPTVIHGFTDPQAVMGEVDNIPGIIICVAMYSDMTDAVKQANSIVQSGIAGSTAIAIFSDDVSEVQCLCHHGVLRASAVVVNSLVDEPIRSLEDHAARKMFVNETTVVMFPQDVEDVTYLGKPEYFDTMSKAVGPTYADMAAAAASSVYVVSPTGRSTEHKQSTFERTTTM